MENLVEEMAEEIAKLKEENKVLKKALELACEAYHYEYGESFSIKSAKDYVDDFIDQAKESMKW